MMDHYLDETGLDDLIRRISELAATKINSESGKGLIADEEKEKLSGIEEGAQVNVQADWSELDDSSDSYVKNKPSINSVPIEGNKSFDELGLIEITNTELEALLV